MIKCLWFRSDEGVAPYIGLSNIKRSCPNPPTNPNLNHTKNRQGTIPRRFLLFLDLFLDGGLDALDQPQDMPFMQAELLVAVLAGEAGVGGFRKPLGVEA